LTDEWAAKGTTAAVYSHIAMEIIGKFQQGHFDDAEEKVQKAWLFCMTELLPCVNSMIAKGRGEALRLHLLSEFVANGDILTLTTRSDKAIIYWFFEACLESDWLKAITEDLAEQSKPTTYEPPAKWMKWQGCQHASRTLVHSYYRWRQKIAEMRCDKSDEALSWELEIKRYIQMKFNEEQQAGKKRGQEQWDENKMAALESVIFVPGANGMKWSGVDFIAPYTDSQVEI
jgi:hypothetical protein